MKNREKEIEENTKKAHHDFLMEYAPYVIIVIFILIIRIFIATPVKVQGSSMNPTLKQNDLMILYKLTKKTRGIKRNDIVVIKSVDNNIIKRVIALPGETITYRVIKDESDKYKATLYINGKPKEEKFISEKAKVETCNGDFNICSSEIRLESDEYFVMGDNRGGSTDSRIIGPVKYKDIKGTTKLIIFPFSRFGFVK